MRKNFEINIDGATDCDIEDIQTFLFENGYHWASGGKNVQQLPVYQRSPKAMQIECHAIICIDNRLYFAAEMTKTTDYPDRLRTNIENYNTDLTEMLSI